MIFLTEGQSAGGTLGGARDAMNQAVFFLRGKCLNTPERKDYIMESLVCDAAEF